MINSQKRLLIHTFKIKKNRITNKKDDGLKTKFTDNIYICVRW